MKAIDHYTGKPIKVRAMTLAEVKKLDSVSHIQCIGTKGVVRVKVDSKVKRWKRDKDRVEVSFKFGLYEHIRIDNSYIGDLTMPGCPVVEV